MNPSLYKPEHCAKILKLYAKGKSMVEVAVSLGVGKSCYYDWIDEHPEFKKAHAHGMALAEAHWTAYGEANMDSPDFNAVFYNRLMGSRFGVGPTRKVRTKHFTETKGKSVVERFEGSMGDFADGEVGGEEAEKLSSTFNKIAEMEEKTDVAKKVDMLIKDAGLESKP